MTRHCFRCDIIRVDLRRRSELRRAQLIADELANLGGFVEVQEKLTAHMHERHGWSHETTQRYVDGLAALGYFEVTYYDVPIKKFVRLVARPLGDPGTIANDKAPRGAD